MRLGGGGGKFFKIEDSNQAYYAHVVEVEHITHWRLRRACILSLPGFLHHPPHHKVLAIALLQQKWAPLQLHLVSRLSLHPHLCRLMHERRGHQTRHKVPSRLFLQHHIENDTIRLGLFLQPKQKEAAVVEEELKRPISSS